MSDNNIQNNLWKTWDTIFTIFPPVKEEHIKVKGYAIIYMGKEIPHSFIACLQKKCRADSDGPAEAIKYACLKKDLGFSNTVFEE